MQEKFIKAFYTVVTKENKKYLEKWRGTSLSVGDIVGVCYCEDLKRFEIGHNPGNCTEGPGYSFGEKVSFEQFKELIGDSKKSSYLEEFPYLN